MNALHNQLQDQQLLNEDLQLQIGDEVVIGKVKNRKGQLAWPQFIDQLILQLCANGTRPSAISENIAVQAMLASKNVRVEELPSEACARRGRGKMRIITELIAAIRLGRATEWKQLHADDASRRQVSIISLVVKIKENGKHADLLVAAHHMAQCHTAEGVKEGIEFVIDRSGIWLDRLGEAMLELHPEYEGNLPSSDEIHLGKLKGQHVSTDTCATANKLSRNLVERIDEVAEEKQVPPLMINGTEVHTSVEPCQQHQRNVCLDAVSSEMTKHIKWILEENSQMMDNIRLRLHMDGPSFFRALDKQFSLTCNYAKGAKVVVYIY